MRKALWISIFGILAVLSCIPYTHAAEEQSELHLALEKESLKNSEITPPEGAESPQIDVTVHSATTSGSSDFLSFRSNLSVDVEQTTGSATTGIPISVPPGRNGIQPNVSLVYNSNMRNGIAGVGWALGVNTIQRSTKNGVPSYDDTDTFVLSQNGSTQELVYDDSVGFYRTETEGAFMKIERVADYWIITDRKGVKYYFGQNNDSREINPDNYDLIYKWYLDTVEDLFGNYMLFLYFRYGNVMHLNEIQYTGNSLYGDPTYTRIDFEYEDDRSDIARYYNAGFAQQISRRLYRISVYADEILQRRYDFDLSQSERTQRSMLDSVVQYGSDEVSTLPAISFAYQEDSEVSYDIISMGESDTGDNLWNCRFSSGFDTGHDNSGSVCPACFPVSWGPTYTQSSGNWSNGWWNISSNGNLSFGASQDTANHFWTFLYVDSARTLQVPYTASGVDGTWINGNYSQHMGKNWSLQEGYNLVEITMYHQHSGFSFSLNYDLANHVEFMNSTQTTAPQLSGDFNGDGLADTGRFIAEEGRVDVGLSNGVTFLPNETWITGFGVDKKLILGDFNADGKTDIGSYSSSDGNWRVALSDGSQFIDNGNWITGFGSDEEPNTGDLNGDGLTDILTFYKSSGTYFARIALNDGTGFSPRPGISPSIYSDNYAPFTADFNGDGLTDFGTVKRDIGTWLIYLNTGNPNAEFYHTATISSFGTGKNPVVADCNSDGLADIGYYNNGQGKVVYMPSTGSTFLSEEQLPFEFSMNAASINVQSSDYNGDGLTDFIAYDGLGSLEIAFSNGEAPDLLSVVDNGIGGLTVVEYAPSTNYNNTYLPFPIQVVKSATVSDSFGASYTRQYSYADGLWDTQEREFRGFGYVKTKDPQGNYVETCFLQDNIFKGRVEKQETYDAAGALFSKTENTWSSQEIIPGVNFAYLLQKDNYVYDGDATGRRTQEQYFYEESPQLGNLTKTIQLGEVDIDTGSDVGDDTRTVETEYVNNIESGNWLIGLPKETFIISNDGWPTRRTYFYYDGHGFDELPTHGLLTLQKGGVGTCNNPPSCGALTRTSYTYDEYGSLRTTVDFNNFTTTITYDSYYHVFPVLTENALGHQVVNEYYGVEGVPLDSGDGYRGLWGQLKSTTDPNDQEGKKSYDVFGRSVATVSPLDSIDFPTTVIEYELTGQYAKVVIKQRENTSGTGTIDAVEFYDGLGRLIQTKTESQEAGKFVVSGQTEYNSRGLPEKKYLPVFSTNPIDSIDPINQPDTHSTITYDAMGRVVQTTNPDGSYATVIYDDWATTTIDENGHMQKSYFDAYGRLVTKEEYSGADGRSAHYPAESYALYATTLYEYTTVGGLKKVTDAHGNITTMSYDRIGRKRAMDDPDMGYWQYRYDMNSNLIKQTDAKGQIIEFGYDGLNRLRNKSDGAQLNVDYTYDDPVADYSKGRLTQAAYTLNDDTAFRYDQLGRENESFKKIDGYDYQVQRSYDSLSRLTSLEYPNQMRSFYSYNRAGQIEAIADTALADPSNKLPFTHFKCNDNASDTTVTDDGWGFHNGSASEDTVNISTTGKINNAFRFNGTDQYVNIDSLAPEIRDDATGTLSYWLYVEDNWDTDGMIFTSGAADKVAWFYTSIANSRATLSLRDSTFGDVLTASAGGPLNTGQWYHFAYVQDGAALKIYIDGVPQTVVLSGGSGDEWFDDIIDTLDNGRIGCINYNNLGDKNFGKFRLDDLRYFSNIALSADDVAVLYNDGNGTEGAITSGDDETANVFAQNVDYNAAGQITQLTYGNGVTTTYAYDPLTLRLSNILAVNQQQQAIQDLSYQYDSVGNIISITDNVNTATQTFQYDALSRLIEAQGSYGTKVYEYDEIGNIIYKAGATYNYGEGDAGPHAVTSASDGSVFEYDANGNMTRMVKDGIIWDYSYDAENRLVSVDKDAKLKVKFAYDGDGGRTKKTTYSYKPIPGGGGKPIRPVIDIEPLGSKNQLYKSMYYALEAIQSFFDIPEAEAAETVTTKTTTYVGSLYESAPGASLQHIYLGDTRIATIRNGELLYYHTDHLGGTNVVTDANGEVKELIEYEPFGDFARHDKYGSDEEVAMFYFTGKQKDDETELYYYGARYYNPSLGRFITADSIVPYASDSQSYNRYAYARNNPIYYTDPDGHFFWAVVIGAILGGISSAVNNQPIWQGMLAGALGGAFIGGGISIATNLGFSGGWGALGGGILGGVANAGITGGDFGIGALTGGLSGLLGWNLGNWAQGWNSNQFWGGLIGATAIGATVSGLGAELSGGEFGEAAWMGAAFGSAGFLTSYAVAKSNTQDTVDKHANKTQELINRINDVNTSALEKSGLVDELLVLTGAAENLGDALGGALSHLNDFALTRARLNFIKQAWALLTDIKNNFIPKGEVQLIDVFANKFTGDISFWKFTQDNTPMIKSTETVRVTFEIYGNAHRGGYEWKQGY